MADEVVSYIKPQENKIYFDGTFGQGGYSQKILGKASCKIFAIDRDPASIPYADRIKKIYPKKFFFEVEKLSNLKKYAEKRKIEKIDGIVLDLGLSNTQLNNSKRGFSFSNDGPLNMRMDGKNDNLTAEKIINEYSEKKLNEIFFYYGEEKNSRKISNAIIEFRKKEKIVSTLTLSKIIEKINFQKKIHPATRVFQALRIFINDELFELENFLQQCIQLLNSKSRIAVVSFHSLEDRIVKRFFKSLSSSYQNNYKHLPEKKRKDPKIRILTKKTINPSIDEIKQNPRSRSAKLRVAEKI